MSTGENAEALGNVPLHNTQTQEAEVLHDGAEVDDFGLPRRPPSRRKVQPETNEEEEDTFHDVEEENEAPASTKNAIEVDDLKEKVVAEQDGRDHKLVKDVEGHSQEEVQSPEGTEDQPPPPYEDATSRRPEQSIDTTQPLAVRTTEGDKGLVSRPATASGTDRASDLASSPIIKRERKQTGPSVSEWSHQQLAPRQEAEEEVEEVQWQAMPALGEYDIYDDDDRIIAKGSKLESDDAPYVGIGGAGKGYTRIILDDDAESVTSMDDDTNYLFEKKAKPEAGDEEDEDEYRDAATQMQATKDLLTEGQRIAYVGVVRLVIHKMQSALAAMEHTKNTKKEIRRALESMDLWGQKMMVRLYRHMEIDTAEQVMIEQLEEHGVQPSDLAPALMLNAKIRNPLADNKSDVLKPEDSSRRPSLSSQPSGKTEEPNSKEIDTGGEVPEFGLDEMPTTKQIDLDLRWTVLCDLFLLLIQDTSYDARSRRLLERVGSTLQISWVQICRFEKRVIDALEGQELEQKENWNESDNLEKRRKLGLKKKYIYMGLATVGGGLVIGLSAGLLAPFIGAGLAAGFTTIGVTGTAGFLGGVGGAALITTAATVSGGTVAIRASNRRTGHVKTFEYRPLHNNKRLNLILAVGGWMTGKVDDVRLPYSTVDPVMGDIYALLWEPEMLRSMGDTINILANEALTTTIQQVLGNTILVALMASLQLPVVLTKLSYLIDNPWTVSLDRANASGLILADSLIDRHLGQRPITLVGFSLGARVIVSCLKELSNRGAYGIIQNVYLFGAPIAARRDDYLRARSVIAGRFVNGYATNDWILAYLFRATSGGVLSVAGLAPVENVPGLENVDVTKFLTGHMAYRATMPRLLREVGWEVESDEFTEIDDPDPENHEQRQRELIQEIEDARKKAEEKPSKKFFGLFKAKRGWETYEGAQKKTPTKESKETGLENNVLFDIEAIRRELAAEMIDVREIDSTLPPMKFTTVKNGKEETEYLRLPPGLSPEEITKLKLPPRPYDMDSGASTPSMAHGSRRNSPLRKGSPRLPSESDFALEAPRELKSTLPPLQLSPSADTGLHRPNGLSRPDFKAHATAPAGETLTRSSMDPIPALTPAVESLSFERNAWAEEDDDFGKEHNISMTFE